MILVDTSDRPSFETQSQGYVFEFCRSRRRSRKRCWLTSSWLRQTWEVLDFEKAKVGHRGQTSSRVQLTEISVINFSIFSPPLPPYLLPAPQITSRKQSTHSVRERLACRAWENPHMYTVVSTLFSTEGVCSVETWGSRRFHHRSCIDLCCICRMFFEWFQPWPKRITGRACVELIFHRLLYSGVLHGRRTCIRVR